MKKQIQRMKQTLTKGFTLVELLVVVAIIAVIGAGIAVTYRSLDDQAKTSMEMSDISALSKVIKHWQALREGNHAPLVNGLDLLVTETGTNGVGIWGHNPFVAATAPDVVIDNLSAAGFTNGFVHLSTATVRNDATFVGSNVDTSTTIRRLFRNASAFSTDLQQYTTDTVAGRSLTHNYDVATGGGPFTWTGGGGAISINWANLAARNSTFSGDPYYQSLMTAQLTNRLAMLRPVGSVASEIISNIGLRNADIADPNIALATEIAAGKKYYLVAGGIGRFASIYTGRSVRADGPPKGKRFDGNNIYSRYLVLMKVPVQPYLNHGHTVTEPPQIVDILNPMGYSVASLEDWLAQERDNARADN